MSPHQRRASIASVGGRRCFWFKRRIVHVIINELDLCHCSNRKNREEKREQLKKFLDLLFLSEEQR